MNTAFGLGTQAEPRTETETTLLGCVTSSNGNAPSRATASYGPDAINSFLIEFHQAAKREKPFLRLLPDADARSMDPHTTTPQIQARNAPG